MSSDSVRPVAVLGAGAWGTVIANLLAAGGREVRLWARRPEQVRQLAADRENREKLPGVPLRRSVTPVSSLEEAIAGTSATFVAVPSRGYGELAPWLSASPVLVSCAKGFVTPGVTRLSDLLLAHNPASRVAVLSGPNLAAEVAAGLPAASVVAAHDEGTAHHVASLLNSNRFRVYTSNDPAGTEIAGAVKNVVALAAGMSDGLELGENAKASIITRGLTELVRVGERLGGRRETFFGLAGLGDIVATCAGELSRNYRAGKMIARGAAAGEVSGSITAEGLGTAQVLRAYATAHDLELPITEQVYAVAFGGRAPSEAIEVLMSRSSKREW